jgi:predicted membrane protein
MPAFKEKFINEISKKDNKISISGLIIDKEDNLIFIDDSTGVISVNIETNLPINTFVRVYGYLIQNNEEMQLQGQIIQDLSNTNKKLYQKIKLLMNQK